MSVFEERMAGDGEVFDASAEGVLAWVRTTRPEPPRADVLAYVRGLQRDGLIEPAEVEHLADAGYWDLRTT